MEVNQANEQRSEEEDDPPFKMRLIWIKRGFTVRLFLGRNSMSTTAAD